MNWLRQLFTRRQIYSDLTEEIRQHLAEKTEALIAEGKAILIVDGRVLKVDAWLKYHPGGDKAIMHMIGRDATDEVTA